MLYFNILLPNNQENVRLFFFFFRFFEENLVCMRGELWTDICTGVARLGATL